MKERITPKKIVLGGLLLAIGIIIPTIFHTTGLPGKVLLPMHIPVLIGGFLLPPSLAFFLGVLTPLSNTLITGMPVFFPFSIIVAFELGAYGFIVALMYRKLKVPSIIALIIAMIMGRIVAGIAAFVFVSFFTLELDPIFYVKTAIITGLPGVIIQIILIPTLIYGIVRYTTINMD